MTSTIPTVNSTQAVRSGIISGSAQSEPMGRSSDW